jgi:hypothetical protein
MALLDMLLPIVLSGEDYDSAVWQYWRRVSEITYYYKHIYNIA